MTHLFVVLCHQGILRCTRLTAKNPSLFFPVVLLGHLEDTTLINATPERPRKPPLKIGDSASQENENGDTTAPQNEKEQVKCLLI